MAAEAPSAEGSRWSPLWPWAAGAVAFVALSPVVFGRYGFSDDYTVLYQQLTDPEKFAVFLRSMGRPLAVPVVQHLFQLFPSIDQLRWVRLVGVLGAAVSAGFLCRLALGLGFRSPLAFLLGALLAALPSTVVAGTWAVLVHGMWGFLLGLAGGALLLRAPSLLSARTVAGAILVTVATCVYQPAAMAFWLVWLLWVLSPSARAITPREAARTSARFLSAMAVASAIGVVVQQSGARAAHMTSARAGLSTDLVGKLAHLTSEVWLRVANPWNASPPWVVAAAMGLLVVPGLLLAPPVEPRRRLGGLLAVVATLLLGYAPSLATAETWVSSRAMLAVMPVLPICLVAVAQGVLDRRHAEAREVAPIAGVIALLAAAWVASFVKTNIVRPQERELELARTAIREATTAPSLSVLPSLTRQSFAAVIDHDEIGLPSTSREWVPVPLVELVYREEHGTWYGQAHLRARKAPTPVTDAAVLDFAALLQEAREAR